MKQTLTPYVLTAAFLGLAFSTAAGAGRGGKTPVQYRLRQIMLEPVLSPEGKRTALKKAEECLKKALAGEDFTELARKYSEEPGADRRGGDLGFFEYGDMVKPFSEAVFSMKPGEIRGPVETRYGYHIIRLLEVRGGRRRAQHILFSFTPGREDTLRTLETLKEIRKRLLEGADFSEMLARYPVDELIRRTEGYMIWLRPEEMLPSFAEAVRGLKEGDVSEPFVSVIGLHIVVVDSINYDPGKILTGFPPGIAEHLKRRDASP